MPPPMMARALGQTIWNSPSITKVITAQAPRRPAPSATIPAARPRSAARSAKLRRINPAPARSTIASATSAITSVDAARRAWADDRTDYTPNGGIPALRQAIVAKLARENAVHVDLEQVWVTVGGTQALHQAMGLLLASGDEVLVPDPGYTTFTMNAHSIGL